MTDPANRNVIAGPDNAGRRQDGRFSPGCSGNPAGMKPGTRHKATRAALALLNGEVDKLTRKAVELALAGDVTACASRPAGKRRSAWTCRPLRRERTHPVYCPSC
jgi:hypothetical protein